MDITSFDDVLEHLFTGESDQVEAKRATKSVGKSALETISAFSNEPGLDGGILLLGVGEKNEGALNYVVDGVADPDKIQNEVASLCRTAFNREIRPTIKVVPNGSKGVVVAYIPEANPHDKPIYIKSKGIDKGAFRRIGSSDQVCTQRDLDHLYQLRSIQDFEQTILEGSSWDDIDPGAILEYRRIRKEIKPNAHELKLDDQDLLLSIRAASQNGREVLPTAAGVLLFAKTMALRRLLPLTTRIDYIICGGDAMGPQTLAQISFH